MRKITIKTAILFMATALVFSACKKSAKTEQAEVAPEALQKIKDLGFSTDRVIKQDGGYLVEGDIFLSEENLNDPSNSPALRIAEVEQYRTRNLITRLPRTITVSLHNLGTAYVQGADLAISRYNAENLQVHFQRVTSGTGNIDISGFNQGPSGGFITLGSSGFPSGGNPYPQILMNTNSAAYGGNPKVNYVGSVIQHEMGHCIGFRHTDYMNRNFSCGSGGGGNEGAGSVGAIQIPGTPSGPDSGSWMLSCSNGGNRTFNANDRIALNYLY